METTALQKRFIRIGAIAGILASLLYPFIYYLELTNKIDLLLDLVFGFAIGFAAYGIFQFIGIHRDSVCLRVGVLTGILAAFTYILSSSILVAVTAPLEGILIQGDQSFVYGLANRPHIGVIFIFDMLIGSSILSFSLAFFRQPRPGKIITIAGILFALIIIIYSIYTFPEMPEDFSSHGIGVILPAWHFAVCILMIFSLKWIRVKSHERQ